ncbi:MAG: hypothetical protein EBX67_11560, partial [Betaproteobacteria bacterium]|nr:hypothetical protein [Betaproteobacteria bacterium]
MPPALHRFDEVGVVLVVSTAAPLAERPAALVELVRILVAEIAVAGEAVPVPVVVEPLADRDDRGRGMWSEGAGADAVPAVGLEQVG